MSDPQLDPQVEPTRLLVALGRVNRAVRRDATAGEVGHGALSVLATLVADGPQRAGALAATEGVSPPSLNRIVAALEELGHVRRLPDPVDGRACIVEVTTSGRHLVQAGRAARMAALADRIAALEPTARAALAEALPALEQLSQDD